MMLGGRGPYAGLYAAASIGMGIFAVWAGLSYSLAKKNIEQAERGNGRMNEGYTDAPIRFFNRKNGIMETEAVYGDAFLRWAYGSPLGRLTVALAIQRPVFSGFYGWLMDRSNSRKKIAPFVEKYGIEMDDFVSKRRLLSF